MGVSELFKGVGCERKSIYKDDSQLFLSESCVGFISLTFLRFSSTLMCIEHYLTVLAALLL